MAVAVEAQTITLPRTVLLAALRSAAQLVPAKSPLPVLAGVLIEADAEGLCVTVNDLEVALTLEVPGLFADRWVACPPAEILAAYVASLSSAEVRLTLKGLQLEVRGGGSHATLSGFEPDDFPRTLALGDGAWEVTLPAPLLREAITQTAYAAATDDSRPVLSGVLLRIEGSTLTLAAADGFRLAVRTVRLADAPPLDISLLVPATALRHLLHVLPTDDDATVTLAADTRANRAAFRWDGGELSSRLIEGQFPDFKRIIPTQAGITRRLELEAGDLLAASRTTLVLSKTNSNIVWLRADDDTLLVSGMDGGADESESRLTVTYDGEGEGQIAVNGKYLTEALGQILGTCEVGWTTPTQPMVVRPLGSEDQLAVLMPMHVAGVTQ